MRVARLCLGSLALVASFAAAAAAQAAAPATAPCSAAEFRQFDFWVGDWDLTWPGSKPDEVQHGRNTISRKLGDCVIEEQFDGSKDAQLRGQSVSVFSPRLKKWQQTWVDDQGAYMDFDGEFSRGQMILARQTRNQKGEDITQRMVFKNIAADSLDWSWEQSKDGGKTWTVVWPIHYVRRSAK
jgi:hypothetical protein